MVGGAGLEPTASCMSSKIGPQKQAQQGSLSVTGTNETRLAQHLGWMLAGLVASETLLWEVLRHETATSDARHPPDPKEVPRLDHGPSE